MRRLVVSVGLMLAMLALAVFGQYRVNPEAVAADPWQAVYQAVQLFGFNGDWTREHPSIEVQWARFLAPLVALLSVVLVFVRGAWIGTVNAFARFRRDHVVLVGLNTLGWHFVRSCRQLGLRAVAIERDEDSPFVEPCRHIGVPVIIGDALRTSVLRRAGVSHASHLVTFVTDDGMNVELTLRVKSFSRELATGRDAPLRVHCHLTNTQLAERLVRYPKFFLHPHLAEIRFFNVHDLAARTLLHRHPPEVYADALRCRDVHVVVYGVTSLAEQVVLQVARTAHYATFERPRITWCTQDVAALRERLERIYPGLHSAARLAFAETPLSPDAFEESRTPLPMSDATAYVVCLEDESEGLSLALAIRDATLLGRGMNAPVLVAMQRSDGLARLLESELGTPEIPDGLYPFGMLDDIVSASNIVDERLDGLAQAIHENYLEASAASKQARPRPSHVPWSALPEMFRSTNRLAADHLDVKLRAIGCREEAGEATFELGRDELEKLAHMEHNRWLAMRYSMGWRPGEERSDLARVDDQLIEWEALDTAGRVYDMSNAREVPSIVRRRTGRTVRRDIVIGVTGHRLHRLSNHGSAFYRALERTLTFIRTQHPGAAFTVMSSLAEGADRLVARAAMDVLDARLHVPLPLPYDLYLDDFGASTVLDREASLSEFHELLGRAERYFELPALFGNQIELARTSQAGAHARARQYALAGAYVVQRSHELLAVWDGEAHEGEGGTAQIVQWRVHGVPEPYRFPDVFFPPVERTAPFVVPPDVDADFTPRRLGE